MTESVAALLQDRASEDPDAPYLVDAEDGTTYSRGEVLHRAERWAAFFVERGVSSGGRVAVSLPNSIDFVGLYFGAALAGVTLCPYNPALGDGELCDLAERFEASFWLSTVSQGKRLAANGTLDVVTVGPKGHLPAALPEMGSDLPAVDGDTLLVLVMTSGTTGTTKACRILQRNVVATSRATRDAFGLGASSRYLTPLPLFHINAQVIGLLAALQGGGVIAVGKRLPAAKLWAAAERCEVDGMSTVPAIIFDLLASDAEPPAGLQWVVCSSAPLPERVLREFTERFGIEVRYSYGLSEAGCYATYGDAAQPVGSCGRAVGCEVRVVDEDGQTLPTNAEGEVEIRGPGVFEGYDASPEATASTFRDDWLRTGDLGSIDGAGYLRIRGRLKEMINRGGEKISPSEVEDVIRQVPGVSAAAVFAVTDERLGEDVACAVVLERELSDEDLWDACADAGMADFKTPKTWVRLDELPTGGTGKVLRRVLRSRFGKSEA